MNSRLILMVTAMTAMAADPPAARVQVSLAAPGLLAVTIDNGEFIRHGLEPYVPREGDSIVRPANSRERRLWRSGRHAGGITGPEGGPLLVRLWDEYQKPMIDMAINWDVPARFRISSEVDEAYRAPQSPVSVARKSKPLEVRRIGANAYGSIDRHVYYLELPAPLTPGAAYTLEFPSDLPPATFEFAPERTVTESLHVNHLGFRADDPSKMAFLSLWAGTRGGYDFGDEPSFQVIDEETGEVRIEGMGQRAKPKGETGEDAYELDHTLAPVWILDLTALNIDGRYRIVLPGVGVSQVFEIGAESTWKAAFKTAARGLFHQRSGMAFEEPFTLYTRPRPYHPEDGLQVFHSNAPYVSFQPGENGQDAIFQRLAANATTEVVPNAWGGYFDAGDWDRNIQHLKPSRALLRLWEFAPEPLGTVAWNIPKSDPVLPDILEEALWCVEFFERLQTEAGGIRGGIEAEEHPIFPDPSWLESLKVMAFEPDVYSSWAFAASGAQASRLLARFDEARAARIRASAVRAFEWAEARWAEYAGPAPEHRFRDMRNLAAVELWRLTAEDRYLATFLETTAFAEPGQELDVWQKHDQAEAAVSYLLESTLPTDEPLRANLLTAVRASAEVRWKQSRKSAFRWTKNPWAPTGWGTLGAPLAEYLVYAHRFTGEEKYLKAAIDAAQHSLGANPSNMTYTTGLGHTRPSNPLIVDPEVTAHPHPPEGIVVYGPAAGIQAWSLSIWNRWCVPAWPQWPLAESYVNLGLLDPMTNEYTIQQTNTPAIFVWGYLATRP